MCGSGLTIYRIGDKTIPDIRQWCRDRKEKMVVVEWTQREPNILTGEVIITKEITETPESFWKARRINFSSFCQGTPKEIRRYDP